MPLPSEAKNIGPYPTLRALIVDLYNVLLKAMKSSRHFCSSAELSNWSQYYPIEMCPFPLALLRKIRKILESWINEVINNRNI